MPGPGPSVISNAFGATGLGLGFIADTVGAAIVSGGFLLVSTGIQIYIAKHAKRGAEAQDDQTDILEATKLVIEAKDEHIRLMDQSMKDLIGILGTRAADKNGRDKPGNGERHTD